MRNWGISLFTLFWNEVFQNSLICHFLDFESSSIRLTTIIVISTVYETIRVYKSTQKLYNIYSIQKQKTVQKMRNAAEWPLFRLLPTFGHWDLSVSRSVKEEWDYLDCRYFAFSRTGELWKWPTNWSSWGLNKSHSES